MEEVKHSSWWWWWLNLNALEQRRTKRCTDNGLINNNNIVGNREKSTQKMNIRKKIKTIREKCLKGHVECCVYQFQRRSRWIARYNLSVFSDWNVQRWTVKWMQQNKNEPLLMYNTAMHLRIGLVCFKVKISQLNVCNKLHNDDDQFPKTSSIKGAQICFRLAQLNEMKMHLR